MEKAGGSSQEGRKDHAVRRDQHQESGGASVAAWAIQITRRPEALPRTLCPEKERSKPPLETKIQLRAAHARTRGARDELEDAHAKIDAAVADARKLEERERDLARARAELVTAAADAHMLEERERELCDARARA